MEVDKVTIGAIAATVLVLGGIFIFTSMQQQKLETAPADTQCITHAGLGIHIHPTIAIFEDDKPVTVPANIGITDTCMRPVHTHDESGTIHVEYPVARDFMLADFFANWGQPFNSTTVLDKKTDDTHTLTMTVDGKPSTDFEKTVLKDKEAIVIHYDTKK
jgi:hypothetical protein